MAELTPDIVKRFLDTIQGQNITVNGLRQEFNLLPGTKSYDGIRVIIHRLVEQRILRAVGNRGEYRVVRQIQPVKVFKPGRERRPVFNLMFPRDIDKGIEMDFADSVIIREGDLITIGGIKSSGKTFLCLNFCAENLDNNPVLMGNEYTVSIKGEYEPAPRFISRLDTMGERVRWYNEEGEDRFTLLPVRDDYAEHIVTDRINIIDWINLDGNALYDIGKVLESIKSQLGRGVAIIALQKSEGAFNPRGGQFVRDFSDLELLLDGFGENSEDVLLTVKGVKESTTRVAGRTFAYTVTNNGTDMINFREVKKCPTCRGNGLVKGNRCDTCYGSKYVDK